MTTAVYDVLDSIPVRIPELSVLVTQAHNLFLKIEKLQREGKDFSAEEEFYNILCRSCSVLMSSHLEGFLKDFSKSLESDLNYNLKSFRRMPRGMQRAFCQKIAYYEGVQPSEIDTRINYLISFFESNSVPIDMDAFPYKENANKNPGYAYIDKIFEKFGISNIIRSLDIPQLSSVFNGDERAYYILSRNLIRSKAHAYYFPYKGMSKSYIFQRLKGKVALPQTIWHTFIEDMLVRRHKIVHGDTLSNISTWDELYWDVKKVNVLMFGLVYSVIDILSGISM